MPADLMAIHAGHHDVEQDEVGPVRHRHLEPAESIAGGHDLVADGFEADAQGGGDLRVIFND